MVNLTDQELNEWVAQKIMGWVISPNNRWRTKQDDELTGFCWSQVNGVDLWDPTRNLNHTHLMEEKIREMGYDDIYAQYLESHLKLSIVATQHSSYTDNFKLIHATARQRCEAAWLIFNKEKAND